MGVGRRSRGRVVVRRRSSRLHSSAPILRLLPPARRLRSHRLRLAPLGSTRHPIRRAPSIPSTNRLLEILRGRSPIALPRTNHLSRSRSPPRDREALVEGPRGRTRGGSHLFSPHPHVPSSRHRQATRSALPFRRVWIRQQEDVGGLHRHEHQDRGVIFSTYQWG